MTFTPILTNSRAVDLGRYAFCPGYTEEDQEQRIVIAFEGESGFYNTGIFAGDLDDAEMLCDTLNAPLGLERETWEAIVAANMAHKGE